MLRVHARARVDGFPCALFFFLWGAFFAELAQVEKVFFYFFTPIAFSHTPSVSFVARRDMRRVCRASGLAQGRDWRRGAHVELASLGGGDLPRFASSKAIRAPNKIKKVIRKYNPNTAAVQNVPLGTPGGGTGGKNSKQCRPSIARPCPLSRGLQGQGERRLHRQGASRQQQSHPPPPNLSRGSLCALRVHLGEEKTRGHRKEIASHLFISCAREKTPEKTMG